MMKSLIIEDVSYSYLDAEILKRKIYRALVGEPLNSEDNFDIVNYSKTEDTKLVDSMFTLIEQYINLDIYKQTGISYTEYKNMTPLEKNIMLDFLTYKIEVEDFDYKESMKSRKEEDNSLNKSNNDYDLFAI